MHGGQHGAGDARRVERRLGNRRHAVHRLAEVHVLALLVELVVALDRCQERLLVLAGEAHDVGQPLKRVGLLQHAVLQRRADPEVVQVVLADRLKAVHVGVERGPRRRRHDARAAAGIEALGVLVVLPVEHLPAVMAGLVARHGIAHGVALVLVHEALAARIHVQVGLASHDEQLAVVGLAERGVVGHAAAVPDHRAAAGLELTAGPQGHLDALALLARGAAGDAPVGHAGLQRLEHLVVGAVAAGAQDDALRHVDLDVAAVGLRGVHAGHAAVGVLDQLLGGREELNLAAQTLEDLAQHAQMHVGGVVRAVGVVLAKAGVVAHGGVVGVLVVGFVPFEREQHAQRSQRFGHPLDHLAGLLGPGAVQRRVDVAGLRLAGVVDELRHVLGVLAGQLGVQRADGLACACQVVGRLQHDDLRARLRRGGGGHHAAVAGADHDHVGVEGLGDLLRDGRLLAPIGLLGGLLALQVLLRGHGGGAATRQRAGGSQGACCAEAGEEASAA